MAEIVEVEENSTNKMQTLRIPPVITVKKSAAYVIYELTYIQVCSLMEKKAILHLVNFESWREIERKENGEIVENESFCFLK